MSPFEGALVALWSEEPGDLEAIERVLAQEGAHIKTFQSAEQLGSAVEDDGLDLIVVALRPSIVGCLDGILESGRSEEGPPVLVVSDLQDDSLYLEAMEHGAFDAVGLPLDEREFIRIAGNALEMHRLKCCCPQV